jgi:hypothetical protein
MCFDMYILAHILISTYFPKKFSLKKSSVFWDVMQCRPLAYNTYSSPCSYWFSVGSFTGLYLHQGLPREACSAIKRKAYKLMEMQMFAILDKAKPDTENIRGLDLAAVKRTGVQVTRLPL